MSDVAKTLREELECKKKYLYEYSMFFECNDGWKCQILEDDVCDLLNKFSSEIEELNISISLFEDDIATKDKKIGEQQATINKLKEENEQLKKELKGLNRKYIAFSEATDKRLKEMMKEMMK